MSKLIDLTGKKFGRLLVLERCENHIQPNGQIKVQWLCKCDCGKKIKVQGSNIKSGHTVSCGCFDKERKIIHGEWGTRLYCVWAGIKSRCYNKKNKQYKDYGGRGIVMCDEWKNSYQTFCDWSIKNGYEKKAKRGYCTIDRIDNNGNYFPNNCKWVSMHIQSRHKRNNIVFEFNGKKKCISDWAKILNIPNETLRNHYHKGDIIDYIKKKGNKNGNFKNC